MIKGNCLVGQSGGPTAVINASLEGIILEALRSEEIDHVYGAFNGLDGILQEKFVEFTNDDLEDLDLLITTPSAILGSVRYKLPEEDEDITVYEKIRDVFIKKHISYFFYIGGNDSMDTCHKIAQYLLRIEFPCQVIGIPKTIDNDMVETDHTPGYPSAAKFIATTISEIYQDIACYETGRVTFVEIMGRDAGWLTCSSYIPSTLGMAPDLIYVPEVPFKVDLFLEDVSRIYQKNKRVMIAVAEGIKDEAGVYFLQKRLYNNNDDFGHLQLGGVGMVLAEIVNKELKLPVRSIELNINQRCASHLLSYVDIKEAINVSIYGVRMALKGITDKAVIIKRISDEPYEIYYDLVSLDKVANLVKKIPLSWLNERKNGINDEYLKYIMPLIKGEVKVPYKNGLPQYYLLKNRQK